MCSRPIEIRAPIQNDEISATIIDTWLGEDGVLNEYEKLEEKHKKNLPYHINLIDLLRPKASEPTHSLIFGRLLKQNKNGEFQILNEFIEYLSERKNEFNDLQFSKPRIKIEPRERIDIWVLDEKPSKALIIENKIHDAIDQDTQLCRYIEATINTGVEEKNIYIIYMPGDEGKEPCDHSWGKYKNKFKGRYLKLTFRELLKWLKDKLLPSIKRLDASKDEVFLRSALEQYIDHLEGENMFRSHNRFHEMNDKQKKSILKTLKLGKSLTDSPAKRGKRLEVISQKKGNLREIIRLMDEIEKTEKEELFESLKKCIEEKYNHHTVCKRPRKDGKNKVCNYYDISFPQGGTKKTFNVSVMDAEDEIYYGITTENLKNKKSIKNQLSSEYFRRYNYTSSDYSNEFLCYHKELKLNDVHGHLLNILHLIEEIDRFVKVKYTVD